MRRLASDQTGLTLIELVVTMALGLIILTAVLSLVDTAQHSTNTSTQRADATQRGRTAMNQMIQGLRSQVCLKKDAASAQTTVTSATDTSVTFFTNIGRPDTANQGLPKAFAPQLRTYSFSAGKFIEQTSDSVLVSGAYTFPAVTRTRTLLTDSAQAYIDGKAVPVFRYFAYKTDGSLDTVQLPTPVPDADLPRIAQISVAFVAKPTDRTSNSAVQVAFTDDVTLRLLFPAPKTAVQNRTVACTI